MSTKSVRNQTRWSAALQPNYGTPNLAIVSGKGCILTDVDGRKYLDFLGGIATNVLGQAHPAVVSAVTHQIKTLGHVSNFYSHPGVIELSEELQKLSGDKNARVFFCNSGAEANEAALKLSRKTGRAKIVAAQGAFHGRTMGALSLTGQESKRAPFTPLVPGVVHVPYGDIEAMKVAIDSDTAMVILEPIMGEAGVVVPPEGYLKSVRKLCTTHGALLVIDAVQTGMGRTGDWFGYESEGIKPDIITLAKGLGGGLPLGAMVACGKASTLFKPGDHGSTFGGNPVACASALAVIKVLKKERLLAKTKGQGEMIKKAISGIEGVSEVRGKGLLLGIVTSKPIAVILRDALQDRGVLVNAATENVIRIAPALIVTEKQINKFVKVFEAAIKEVLHDKF
jgi:acetylornithine/N-succinyldiaminopimelate aminotransferase